MRGYATSGGGKFRVWGFEFGVPCFGSRVRSSEFRVSPNSTNAELGTLNSKLRTPNSKLFQACAVWWRTRIIKKVGNHFSRAVAAETRAMSHSRNLEIVTARKVLCGELAPCGWRVGIVFRRQNERGDVAFDRLVFSRLRCGYFPHITHSKQRWLNLITTKLWILLSLSSDHPAIFKRHFLSTPKRITHSQHIVASSRLVPSVHVQGTIIAASDHPNLRGSGSDGFCVRR